MLYQFSSSWQFSVTSAGTFVSMNELETDYDLIYFIGLNFVLFLSADPETQVRPHRLSRLSTMFFKTAIQFWHHDNYIVLQFD